MQLTRKNIKKAALVNMSVEMRITNKGEINSKYLNFHLVSAFLCLTLHSQFSIIIKTHFYRWSVTTDRINTYL